MFLDFFKQYLKPYIDFVVFDLETTGLNSRSAEIGSD